MYCWMFCRIYIVHDEVKDKSFELELSWVGEGNATFPYTHVFLSVVLSPFVHLYVTKAEFCTLI